MTMRMLFLCAAFASAAVQSAFAQTAELLFDGNFVAKSEIREMAGVPCIPIKDIAALLKGKTQWYPIAGKVVLQVRNRKISFSPDSRSVNADDRKFKLSVPARLIKGTIYIPIDFLLSSELAELSECSVKWNASSRVLEARPRATILAPRIYTRSGLTRIVIETTEDFAPELKQKGRELSLEFPRARAPSEEEVSLTDSIVQSLKIKQERRGAIIKVMLAAETTDYRLTRSQNPDRFVLELGDKISASETPPELNTPAQKSPADITSPVPSSPSPKMASLQVRRIVVDAGHGGKDAGAVGKRGTREKDINLMIALELAQVLRTEGGYEVFLTRTDDTFVSLVDRTLFANDNKADLFISVHCNASISKKRGGFEIYFLADEASDPHAEAAAELENSAEQLEEEEHADKREKLLGLLSSMAKAEFLNESALLCSAISKAVSKRTIIENRGVKQANFHVLHGAQMPSVLVETAFITYSSEEEKLRKKKFRSAMVDSIFTGVENYQKQLAVLYERGK